MDARRRQPNSHNFKPLLSKLSEPAKSLAPRYRMGRKARAQPRTLRRSSRSSPEARRVQMVSSCEHGRESFWRTAPRQRSATSRSLAARLEDTGYKP